MYFICCVVVMDVKLICTSLYVFVRFYFLIFYFIFHARVLLAEVDQMNIDQAMKMIESGTCVRFVPRSHERDFLDIQPKSG